MSVSLFWGLNMRPNRKYTQKIMKPFHISGMAIDEGENAKLYIIADKQQYVVATVSQNFPQVQLDLNISAGDEIIFQTIGDATVSLLGYLHENDYESDIDSDQSDAENFQQLRKSAKSNSKAAGGDENDDDDEDVSDSELVNSYFEGINGDSDDEGEEEEEEEDDIDEEEDESDEDEVPKAKQAKLDPKPAAKAQNGVKHDQKQKNKKEKNAAETVADSKKEPSKAKESKQTDGERALSGGVKIQDVHVGNGPDAKSGKRCTVYYIGRLKSNNKTFDSTQKGPGFKFKLGAGQVIKGWDIGIVGMKVGGKRRITCPPHMAYGAQGSPPQIPPNSTLVFDVELKSVN